MVPYNKKHQCRENIIIKTIIKQTFRTITLGARLKLSERLIKW